MSYHLYLVRKETRDKAARHGNASELFERGEDLEPLTKAQLKALASRLEIQ